MNQKKENEFGNITNKNQKVSASVFTHQASNEHQRIIQCQNADLYHIRSVALNISKSGLYTQNNQPGLFTIFPLCTSSTKVPSILCQNQSFGDFG